MGVSLYTSRIVLNTLGVSDFGVYNIVGGVVMMFAFLNSSMVRATSLFLPLNSACKIIINCILLTIKLTYVRL